jgi:hypothetical protein
MVDLGGRAVARIVERLLTACEEVVLVDVPNGAVEAAGVAALDKAGGEAARLRQGGGLGHANLVALDRPVVGLGLAVRM